MILCSSNDEGGRFAAGGGSLLTAVAAAQSHWREEHVLDPEKQLFTASFVGGGIDLSEAVNNAAHEWTLAHGFGNSFRDPQLAGGSDDKSNFYKGGSDAAGKISGVIADWKERHQPPDINALLGWIEATLVLLSLLVGGGVTAYFYPVWLAHRRQVAAGRLRTAERSLDTEELIGGAEGGGGGGGSGGGGRGSDHHAAIGAGSQAPRITAISSDDV